MLRKRNHYTLVPQLSLKLLFFLSKSIVLSMGPPRWAPGPFASLSIGPQINDFTGRFELQDRFSHIIHISVQVGTWPRRNDPDVGRQRLVTLVAVVEYFYTREYWVIIHNSPILWLTSMNVGAFVTLVADRCLFLCTWLGFIYPAYSAAAYLTHTYLPTYLSLGTSASCIYTVANTKTEVS